MPSWRKLLSSNFQEIVRRKLVFECSYSALPKEVSHLLWNYWPPRNCQATRRGIHKWVRLAFPETAWDVLYLTHLCFHPHLIKPTKADRTSKLKEETVLDHVVFWFSHVDRQVKTGWSPCPLWDLAGKALLTPASRIQNGNSSVSLSGNIRST